MREALYEDVRVGGLSGSDDVGVGGLGSILSPAVSNVLRRERGGSSMVDAAALESH